MNAKRNLGVGSIAAVVALLGAVVVATGVGVLAVA